MYLIVDTAKLPASPSTAHARLAIQLAKIFNAALISTKEETEALNVFDYRTVIIVGSAFYPGLAAIEAFIRRNSEITIVWINNEYTCSPNSQYASLIKRHRSIVISNVIELSNKVRGYNEFHLTNLNCLLYDDAARSIEKKYNLLYYGTYRAGRRVYLQSYFQYLDFYLSSSKKNLRRFKFIGGCKAIWCDKLNWEKQKETLNLFRYSIYIEDEYTHKHYNHLANRFYESLMCNVVQFFDINCLNTIKQSGYEISDEFIVSSYEELSGKIKNGNFDEYFKKQQRWKKQAIMEKIKTVEYIKEVLND